MIAADPRPFNAASYCCHLAHNIIHQTDIFCCCCCFCSICHNCQSDYQLTEENSNRRRAKDEKLQSHLRKMVFGAEQEQQRRGRWRRTYEIKQQHKDILKCRTFKHHQWESSQHIARLAFSWPASSIGWMAGWLVGNRQQSVTATCSRNENARKMFNLINNQQQLPVRNIVQPANQPTTTTLTTTQWFDTIRWNAIWFNSIRYDLSGELQLNAKNWSANINATNSKRVGSPPTTP